jgi:uncharacterized protein YggU (UPF0235/DUF167 family)
MSMKTRVTLKVRAGAPVTKFAGEYGEGWKLQIAAPPVDGKANDAIIRFISKVAGVARAQVRIVAGASASAKIVEVEGVGAEALRRAILESHGCPPDTGSAAARKA